MGKPTKFICRTCGHWEPEDNKSGTCHNQILYEKISIEATPFPLEQGGYFAFDFGCIFHSEVVKKEREKINLEQDQLTIWKEGV